MTSHADRMPWVIALAALLALAGEPAHADEEAGDGQSLVGPVQGMGEHRKIMPLPTVQIDPARADPNATPAERPLRPFSGWVGPRGCGFAFEGTFLGRLQDGRISGMAGEGVNFDWPIDTAGRFGGRLPLKQLDSGDRVFQRIDGRVEGDRLFIDVEYGVDGRADALCRNEGVVLTIG